ncbi:MAG: peptidoglycan-binding protein [Actinobacteria bacterium]|nr:peptidoglycan-binding protein [Actinomycetota bacterium]
MRTIARGDRGPAVADIQKRLHDLGFSPPGFEAELRDSVFGAYTEQAVREFQAGRGLRVDGCVDEATWHELVEASFRLGDRFLYLRVPPFRGDDVRELQEYLNRLGFDAGREDGIFGADTDRALRAFQHNMGLPVDGIAGSSTISCLQRLRHAMKEVSVAEVHEALRDRQERGKEGRGVVLDAAAGHAQCEDIMRRAGEELSAQGLVPIITGGCSGAVGESQRARLANEKGADVVLSLRPGDQAEARYYYFGGRHYSSRRGKRLAELLREEVARLTGAEGAAPEGRNYPLLRETRMPCVIMEWPPDEEPPAVLCDAIARAVLAYFTPLEEEGGA